MRRSKGGSIFSIIPTPLIILHVALKAFSNQCSMLISGSKGKRSQDAVLENL